ncbi:hypothetical protein EGW08_023790, partial [Elysia chlorotica]
AITDPNSKLSQFADDCALWKSCGKFKKNGGPRAKVKFNKLIKQLGDQATKLIQQVRKLGLKVNTHKTKAVTFGDGSKKGSIVSLGVYSKDLDLKINKRITDNNSTTAAELAAIDEAIKTIQEKKIESENIVILTDSLAATISIKNPNKTNARQDLTESINIRANDLQEKNQTQVQICWIPAHCNIEGNEKADKQAKLGLSSKTRRKTGLGPSEVKSIINQYKNKMWQDMWTNNPKGRFFHAIAPQ